MVKFWYKAEPRGYFLIRGPLKCPGGLNFDLTDKIRHVSKMARKKASFEALVVLLK